jgi:hypothetical protein
MEQTKEILTVKRLLRDLQDFDENAEVAATIDGIPMTLAISGLTKALVHDEENKPLRYALLIIPAHTINAALEFAALQATPAPEGLQIN